MNKYVLIFVVWLVLVAVFGTAGYLLVKPATSRSLRDNGVVTQGKVIALEPDNHRLVRYSYSVEGRTYTGIGHGGSGNPKFDDLVIGTPLRVVYDSTNPSESFLGSPRHDFEVNRSGAIFLGVVPPTLIALTLLGILVLTSRARRAIPR